MTKSLGYAIAQPLYCMQGWHAELWYPLFDTGTARAAWRLWFDMCQIYTEREEVTMKQYQNPIRLPEPETIGKENVWAKVGDPFVYRFNGRYYLYPSAGAEGIEVWESEDLTDWQYIGIVADDPILG